MSAPAAILVSGIPGSGKTTLATTIAGELCLPLISKDAIKERMFDMLGWSDRAWSQKLGMTSSQIMYLWMEQELRVDRSFVAENAFHVVHASREIRRLQHAHRARFVQLFCVTDPVVLLARIQQRHQAGGRHAGHDDYLLFRTPADLENLPHGPLALDGPIITVDTTDPTRIDHAHLIRSLRAHLAGA